MKTEITYLPSRALEYLKAGEIIIFPTETVYGIGADIRNINAINKIYELKARSKRKAFSLHISKKETIYDFAENISPKAEEIINNFMPGPITLILKKKKKINFKMFCGEFIDTIAFRFPEHKESLELINLLGSPIAGSSANISGQRSLYKNSEIIENFEGKVPCILLNKEENCKYSLESTIIDASQDQIIIKRQGALIIELD